MDEEEGAEAEGSSHPWGALDEEDDFDDKADEFETAYNFRYEEPYVQSLHTPPPILTIQWGDRHLDAPA